MSDFEERLRTTVTRRSESFDPSPDLPDRIDARVSHHRRRRQLVTGGLVSMAAATVAVVALVGFDRYDDDPIRMTDDNGSVVTRPDPTSTPSTPTTTPTTSTADASTSSTTAAPPETPPTPGLDPLTPLTPLSRQGIGPITAGMTLREAQAAGRVTITPSAGGGATCVEALIDGFDPSPILVVEPSGADPMDGIVRAVAGSVLSSDDGAMVGQSRAELLASLGQPTRVEDASADIGFEGELLVFESGGYAYGALVVNDMVLGLQSGDPDWVSGADGCP